MTRRVHEVAAEGFDRGADAYERARPGYPDDAIALIVAALRIGPGRRILDLAAGTGKLTRLLVPFGADLVAVEPVAAMRAHLGREVRVPRSDGRSGPGIEVLDGTAEQLPRPDASLDGVVCAQAWHWFDSPAALREMARVLRPGGGLAVVFNIRDETVDWVRQVTEITEFADAHRPHHRRSRAAFADDVAAVGDFGPVSLSTFRYGQILDPDLLVDRMASQSNVAIMDERHRAAVLDEVRELARTHPDLAGRDTFEMPYDTEVAICFRT